jgi:hypothetical protein
MSSRLSSNLPRSSFSSHKKGSSSHTSLTRAQIRDPFDDEIITPEVESSNTIDTVKAKIHDKED